MKNRIKVTIAIVSGLAVIALIIGLASCNKKASPDISSSKANEEETEITSDASSEVVTSGSSEEATPTSSFSQANTETSEESTETTTNIEVAELITFLMLNTDDDILICDPEGEYAPLVEAMGPEMGSVIRVSAGGRDRLNAMYMVDGYG
ncbi:MAG: hypothetical protein VZR24_23980, partial [Butyrivibrio hungatei]|nr:hypothetical protein [Butyrivibrio hungatei]